LEKNTLKIPQAVQKTYDLILWVVPILVTFPKSHKFLLGDRIESKLLDLLDNLLAAYYSKEREQALRQASLEVEQVRFLFRLVKDLGIVNVEKYKNASEKVDEIGKMIGGWMKTLPKH
jgi:four helix bundle protein